VDGHGGLVRPLTVAVRDWSRASGCTARSRRGDLLGALSSQPAGRAPGGRFRGSALDCRVAWGRWIRAHPRAPAAPSPASGTAGGPATLATSNGPRELRLVLTAPDYDVALSFYRDALGLRGRASFVDDNGGRATLLEAGRATIEIGDEAHAEEIDRVEAGRRVAGSVRLDFDVADPAATTDRLAAAGAPSWLRRSAHHGGSRCASVSPDPCRPRPGRQAGRLSRRHAARSIRAVGNVSGQ
jgi:lactoylglutathione lyase